MGVAMGMGCGGERGGEVRCNRQLVFLYRYNCVINFSILCGWDALMAWFFWALLYLCLCERYVRYFP